jgi:hypothetical protein
LYSRQGSVKNRRVFIVFGILSLIVVIAVIAFACGILFIPAVSILAPTQTPTPSPTSTSTSTFTPSPLPPIYVTLNVNEFTTHTIYWKRDLWENATAGEYDIEDFERDSNDYGELTFPYLTGNGFLLTGNSHAQIINNGSLLPGGNILHFRDWEDGLIFNFPDSMEISAFSFDYKASETWQVKFNEVIITIPAGNNRFIGVILHENFPTDFVLSSSERVQGGLSIDNIGYVSVNTP